MNPLRPAGMIVALAVIIGVVIVSAAVMAEQADDPPEPTSTSAEPTSTPDLAAEDQSPTEDVPVDDPTAEPTPSEEATSTPEPEVEPTPAVVPLSAEELRQHQPNELGKVMVLMYHRLEVDANPDDMYTRTPDKFRQDLQWLYDNNFYVIPIRDYIRNEINAPAGKRPVVLTFDDGVVSQFRFVEAEDGTMEIAPDTAVGILEEFFNRYDDFGRGGLFSVLPNAVFAWPDAPDQLDYAGEKLQWLLDHGYELGNHTVDHVNLRESSDEEIKAELGGAIDMIHDYVPEAEIDVLAVPFGVYPQGGDTSIFEGWEHEGKQYALEAALMVGAEPAPSPVHAEFDPMWIPRINADDSELGKWFQYVEDNPGIIYVSDGNPDAVTIPEDLHPGLVDTLDEAKAEGKSIIRY